MKLGKLLLATTALVGLGAGAALAGDGNRSKVQQTGDTNSVVVSQNGSGNYAGENNGSYSDAVLRQTGNNNTMDIDQTGNGNRIGDHYGDLRGAHQSGDRNVLVVEQESSAHSAAGLNGNVIWGVRQSATAGSTTPGVTNEANLTQTGPGAANRRVSHFIGQIHQTLDGNGDKNLINVVQDGNLGTGYAQQVYNQPTVHGNRLAYASQNGTGNTLDVDQRGAGPVGSHGPYGPRNIIQTVMQDGTNHEATLSQDGYRNYIALVDQSGSGQIATISLTGEGNGANLGTGVNAVAGLGSFASDRGAELAGAAASTVSQAGASNEVHYTVLNGNFNQFGFFQDGTGNKAVGIQIIGGDRNELGVYQSGDNNALVLSTITGSDNVVGLRQLGDGNMANVNISGDRNGGYGGWSTTFASLGLTEGLLVQDGNLNEVSLTVTGNDNLFATMQVGDSNRIVGSQNLAGNQAAVSQNGNTNHAYFNQNGNGNTVSISQGL